MSGLSWFLLGALVVSIPWLFALSWVLDRLAASERRLVAWQDECRHAADLARRGYLPRIGGRDDDAA